MDRTTKDVTGSLRNTPATLTRVEENTVEAIAALFGLAARLLPLIPKADRRRFIEEETRTLPKEFSKFRMALSILAERAPEAPGTESASDLIQSYRAALEGSVGFKPEPPPKV